MTEYFNPNATRYPSRHEVVKTVEQWAANQMPDYTLASIDSTQVSSFGAAFHNPATGETVHLHLNLYPNQSASYPGWHIRNPELWRIGTNVPPNEEGVKVYDDDLEALMRVFPQSRIVFLDNEDDDWHVFGYAALGRDGILGFIQHEPKWDEEDYTRNEDLPYGTVVVNADVIDRVNADMWDYVLHNIAEGLLGKY